MPRHADPSVFLISDAVQGLRDEPAFGPAVDALDPAALDVGAITSAVAGIVTTGEVVPIVYVHADHGALVAALARAVARARRGLLMSASPSMVGGNRGLWALRVPLEHLGSRVYPDMFSLAQAHQAFDGEGQLADDELRARFEHTIVGFMDLVEASKHYPCAKTKWVEYLGERPDPVIDRVE